MTISMYQASVPLMTKMLINLKSILQKAIAHAKAKKIEESALLNARLYPDMFVLTRQVQIACDFGRATAARLAGQEPPAYEENEQSLAGIFRALRVRASRYSGGANLARSARAASPANASRS